MTTMVRVGTVAGAIRLGLTGGCVAAVFWFAWTGDTRSAWIVVTLMVALWIGWILGRLEFHGEVARALSAVTRGE